LSDLIFGGIVRRRGTHVNIPKKGSRGDAFCLGGILGFCAELRREFCWGNFKWDFLEVLVGGPRRFIEEGDHWCAFWEFIGYSLVCEWGDLFI
jgi:hypothetical protein